ncbi:MAG: hypothetical protein LBQ32_02885, partial [Burkholderiaceae bacterium]|nr:hypothetical protein [Burkholderiaceae bacterium]
MTPLCHPQRTTRAGIAPLRPFAEKNRGEESRQRLKSSSAFLFIQLLPAQQLARFAQAGIDDAGF